MINILINIKITIITMCQCEEKKVLSNLTSEISSVCSSVNDSGLNSEESKQSHVTEPVKSWSCS